MPATRSVVLVLLAAGCAAKGPKPSVDEVTPSILCDKAAATATISGAGFGVLVTDLASGEARLERPTVRLVRKGSPTGVEDGVEAEVVLSHEAGTLRWVSEQQMEFDVTPELGLVEGSWDVVVELATGQTATSDAGLVILAPPHITGFEPAELCADVTEAEIGIRGTNFVITPDGTLPTVTAGDQVVVAHAAEDCVDLAGGNGQICGLIVADIDASAFVLGSVGMTVVNPGENACGTEQDTSVDPPAQFSVVVPPTVTAITPDEVCNGGTAEITIKGTRFLEGTEVLIGGVPAVSVEFVDSETLVALLDPSTPFGAQDVQVLVPSGCNAELAAGIDILSSGDLFFVDPPVVPAGQVILVTAYTAQLTDEPIDMYMTDESGTRVDVDFLWSPENSNSVQFWVPADTAAGVWSLAIETADGCGNQLAGAFEVATATLLDLHEVYPRYSWVYDYTNVQIRTRDPISTGKVGFQDLPRVYLTPTLGARDTAGQVQGVSFRDEQLLTAVIPYGLAAGWYDMVVTNPDGTVGWMQYAVQITDQPPPEITSVSPPSLPNSSDGSINILGNNFRDPKVVLGCFEGGVESFHTATVSAWEFGSVTAIVPATLFNTAICSITLTNSDYTLAEYSSISIRNPSENLFPWIEGPDMVEARRAPAAAAGRTSPISRYVYAIGGDDGTIAGAKSTVEAATVSPYGEIGEWSIIGTLPSPRTLSSPAVIGQFVYLVGGHHGAYLTDTIWRARILDPIYVPHFDDLKLERKSPGLGGGSWIYRVAGIYDIADEMNPNGETLPGDPIAIKLPDDGDEFQVTISWTAVDRAIGYRIYRTPVADGASSELEWVADVSGLSWTDTGATTTTSYKPLIEGALGKWRGVAYVNTNRYAACVVTAPDPNPDPEVYYLYVGGGLDKDGNPLTSIEYLPITVVSADQHDNPTHAIVSTQVLSEARSECLGYSVDSRLHSVVEQGESWVYFAGGRSKTGATGTVDSGLVTAGGELDPWEAVDDMTPARAGFGGASASDFLYAFGGHNGGPSRTGVSSELDGLLLPELVNWNSLGKHMNEDRYLPGNAQESSVIFMLGGTTSSTDASATTEYTNY